MGVSLGVSRESVRLAALAATLAAAMYLVVRALAADVALPGLPWQDGAERHSGIAVYDPAAAEPIERPRVLVELARRGFVAGDPAASTRGGTSPRANASGQREEATRPRGQGNVGVNEPPRAKPGGPEPQPGPPQRNGGTTPTESGNPSAAQPLPTAPLVPEVPSVPLPTDPAPTPSTPLDPIVQPVVETVDKTVAPVLPPTPQIPAPPQLPLPSLP